MNNPYWDCNFWQFFQVLFCRIAKGILHPSPLASDEIQIIVLSCIAIACGFLGPFLVLKKMTMLANSISHTILIGVIGSYLLLPALVGQFSSFLLSALVTALLTSFFTGILNQLFKLQEDASIGLVFTAFFALGIIGASLFARDVHLGIDIIMGNADALQTVDCKIGLILATMNGGLLSLLFWPLQCIAFDRNFSKTLGIHSTVFRFLFLFLTSATCIGAFRAVGVLLVLSFLVGPYLTARIFSHRLKPLLFWSSAIGVSVSIGGVAISRHILTVYGLPLSTGAIVSTLLGGIYGILWLVKHAKGLRNRSLDRLSTEPSSEMEEGINLFSQR